MDNADLRDRIGKLGLIDAISDSPLDLGEYLDYALRDLNGHIKNWQDDPNGACTRYSVYLFIRAGIGHLQDARKRYELERQPTA